METKELMKKLFFTTEDTEVTEKEKV